MTNPFLHHPLFFRLLWSSVKLPVPYSATRRPGPSLGPCRATSAPTAEPGCGMTGSTSSVPSPRPMAELLLAGPYFGTQNIRNFDKVYTDPPYTWLCLKNVLIVSACSRQASGYLVELFRLGIRASNCFSNFCKSF